MQDLENEKKKRITILLLCGYLQCEHNKEVSFRHDGHSEEDDHSGASSLSPAGQNKTGAAGGQNSAGDGRFSFTVFPLTSLYF